MRYSELQQSNNRARGSGCNQSCMCSFELGPCALLQPRRVRKALYLAVHAVGHAAVARDGVAKVLDLEAALEARCEEAAEWRDDGRKHGQHHRVQLHAEDHSAWTYHFCNKIVRGPEK